MFSCCLPTSQGSGLRRSHRGGLSHIWRNWVPHLIRRLWPFSRRSQSGAHSSRGQGEKESGQIVDTRVCFELLKKDIIESMVNRLVPSLLHGNPLFLHKFLQSYQTFGTMQQVLDLLLKRCDSLTACAYSQSLHYSSKSSRPLDELKNAISTIFGTWLEKYSDQFYQPPEFACLKQLVEYVQLHMPASDLELRADLLLAQLEDMETMRAKTEALAPAPVPGPTGECQSAPVASCKPEADLPLVLEQESAAVPAAVRAPAKKPPRFNVVKKKPTVSEPLELEPARAGPLLPVEPPWPSPVTMKVRDSTWMHRDKRAKEHRAATIGTTFIRFSSVAQCVVSTVLRHCLMEALARTQERRKILRNHASLSRLRISATQCLMETWEDFCRRLAGPPHWSSG
ncbi:PREDICTED: ral guanine nucleotide dissociation stimulator-like [Chinchilla lanigera]|uniref:ral guanine nucleotide dissociation stimulator-like n=1 Tax=Chinchilla lanigera TaxID=34839 RepID=UPI00038F0A6B|nr:PREDICTED: ral guanine nucleotide dissociation stimulator-like [Chinchilla lanigera]